MFTKKNDLDKITSSLSILKYKVEHENSLRLFDLNTYSEDFFCGLLNIIYDYSLSNINIIEKNASAIDLGDELNSIAIQVTSDNDSSKIHYTIEKFIENSLYNKYKTLKVLIIRDKKSYTTTFDTQSLFTFNKESDIIDTIGLIDIIKSLDIEKIRKISDYLQLNIDLKIKLHSKRNSNEVDTIISLINYISDNKNQQLIEEEQEPDPEHKIYDRFAEHSEILIDLYTALYPIYGAMVNEAKKSIGLDAVKVIVITTFLKQISNKYLLKHSNDPVKALDELTDYFDEKISENGISYDNSAIKFYLVDEIIKCNVFPNNKI